MASEAQKKVGDKLHDAGWVLGHAQEPKVFSVGEPGKNERSGFEYQAGNFTAFKPHPAGTGLVEQQGEDLEQLQRRIDEYESRQVPGGDQTQMTPEQKLESAKATNLSWTTSGARQSSFVVADKEEADVKVVSHLPVENVDDLKGQDAEVVAAAQPEPSA